MPSLIPKEAKGSDKLSKRAAFRAAVLVALDIPEVEAALLPFKTNGSPTGHKVGDNIKGTEQLIENSPAHLRASLSSNGLTLFEKSQIVDSVLRRFWVMDKHGKIDWTPSPKFVARQAKAADSSETAAA